MIPRAITFAVVFAAIVAPLRSDQGTTHGAAPKSKVKIDGKVVLECSGELVPFSIELRHQRVSILQRLSGDVFGPDFNVSKASSRESLQSLDLYAKSNSRVLQVLFRKLLLTK